MSATAIQPPVRDLEQARKLDLACRLMRAAIWASAFHWAAAAALLMVYAHISFGVALAVGAVGVISNLAIDRYLWRRNHPRVAPFLDPMTGELPGGRLPLPWQTRYALPAWALVVIATVTYLATT